LGLSKEFDKLRWGYIEKVLLAFGFIPSWTKWIFSLLSSAFFSILINDSPLITFSPSREIRKGGLLSPFLFILMEEGLRRMLKYACSTDVIKGLALHGNAPLSHQQFMDDNILMGHPLVQESCAFHHILYTLSEASGTSINIEKSHIYFFNTPSITQRNIVKIIGFFIASLPTKYLGPPLIDSYIKHSTWRDLLDKLEHKLAS
jgi:hypothetical protein